MLFRYNSITKRFSPIGLLALIDENEDIAIRFYKKGTDITSEQYKTCFMALCSMKHVLWFCDEHHWVNRNSQGGGDSHALKMLGVTSSFMGRSDHEISFVKFIKKRKGFFIIRRLYIHKGELYIDYYRVHRPGENDPNNYWDDIPCLPEDTYQKYIKGSRECKINTLLSEHDVHYNENLSVYKLEEKNTKWTKWVQCKDSVEWYLYA